MNTEHALNDINRKIRNSKTTFFWTCGIAASCYVAYFVIVGIAVSHPGFHFQG